MDIRILTRDITPFEHLVAGHLCDGLNNAAIADATSHSEKVIENTVSRAARAFGIKSDGETNIRVLLALAYRSHFGDSSFDKLGIDCSHSKIGPDGRKYCDKHVE
jgi:DNA-binding NarL/FixJ family response regulator